MSDSPAVPRGRPRSQHAQDAILKATAAMMREVGYANLSIEGIAARAGVGKQTIYRWWPSKGAVAVDAFLSEFVPPARWVDTGDFRADLAAQLRRVVATLASPAFGPHWAALSCAALHDAAVNEGFRERAMAPSREAHRALIARAQAAGDVRADIDVDIAIDIMYAVIWMRLLVGPMTLANLDADALAEVVLRAIGPDPAATPDG
jgi:AcrR family transcriptional regulator